ncbi:LytR/AlgR family response regulator transcription factor [Phaeodactylibacter xiamenensis]|uniref:LytR/AlgR family response regulator transcription factor n=1 Tax=Phaeodactylibacter xiamenensis TaxID=1524460 RepID=UPI0024A7DF75|nr:response regulator transcription factor [Phaeodactylibacter xiamenensis]
MPGSSLEILIIEDNYSFALELEILLKDLGYNNIAHIEDGERALLRISKLPPDFILMDMHLKGELLGIDIAEKVVDMNIPILFITVSGEEFYKRAKNLPHTAGYLVKPVHPITLQSTIERVISGLNQEQFSAVPHVSQKETLILKQDQTLHKVLINDIVYGKSEGNYLRIYISPSDFFLIRSSIKSFLTLLPKNRFARVHKQYFVSIKHLRSVDLKEFLLKMDGLSLPLSERYQKGLLKALGG